jgi:hypothetical protein
MRNIVGQAVSGNDYFVRESITKLIYRRLNSGANLFMAAPRRVGKTSIMYSLRDNPQDGFSFIYVPTESIDNSELFFKRLFEALLNSNVVSNKVKTSQTAKSVFETITQRVKKIGFFGVELELQDTVKEKYSDIFKELIRRLEQNGTRIILMIDEFPSTVENISKKHGEIEAVNFLKLNRSIRQESVGGIQFIYTGSIGLPAIVNRLNTPESINDLNQIEIPPLSIEDGSLFAKLIFDTAKVPYEVESITYMLNKINWLMPFFIQLTIQEIIDLYDRDDETMTNETVDEGFSLICNRRNNIHFDSYYNRLKDTFIEREYKIGINLLNIVAEGNSIRKDILFERMLQEGIEEKEVISIIESLEYDGYINLRDKEYTFNSPILRLWWNKYIRK